MIHPDSSSVESKDSLMDGAPNQVFNLSNDIESEIDANLVLDLDGIDIPSPTRTIVSDIPTVLSSFEDFYNNDVNIRTIDKSRYILGASIGVVEGFSLQDSPYKDLKKPMLPTQHMLKQEVTRRVPESRVRKLKNGELIALLMTDEYRIHDKDDIAFITDNEKEYRTLLIGKEEDHKNETTAARGPNITFTDRLRYLEVMLSDDVKALYRTSQDVLTRGSLDARNSVMKLVDFYDKMVEVFNDVDFVPETLKLPDLHDNFSIPIKLPLKDYRLTRDKAKDLMVAVRPKLANMVANYELSGAGAGQCRDEEQDTYGHFDLDLCEAGDDRRNFIKNENESYLLYWWHRLDTEDFVQFTICVLDKFHIANATDFALISNKNSQSPNASNKNKENDEKMKREMTANMGKVGDGVITMSYITIQREIENWESTAFTLECKLLEDSENVAVEFIKKRILQLEEKISDAKKRCLHM